MKKQQCERAEVLAGAVALGEATEAERTEYRGHVSACASCLRALGGEREIERVMGVLARARDEETWEPAISLRSKDTMPRWLAFGFSAATAAVALSLGLHAFVAASFGHAPPTPNNPIDISYDGQHITLERRPQEVKAAKARENGAPGLVVHHNVINLKSPVSQPVLTARAVPLPERLAAAPVPSAAKKPPSTDSSASVGQSQPLPNSPPWGPIGRDAKPATIAAAGAPFEQHAESMQVSPGMQNIREAAPIGGDSAINPRPAPIAYSQGAEGTSVFEVAIDEHGNPTKCTIKSSSHFQVLDDAVCRAAMKARYNPKTVNGRPVAGTYSDAFTFHSNSNSEGVEPQNQ